MASASASVSCSLASQLLPRSKIPLLTFHSTNHASFPFSTSHTPPQRLLFPSLSVAAASKNDSNHANAAQNAKNSNQEKEIEVEVEEDVPWIQEKALDVVEFTGTVTQAIPGPRVGTSSLPWILAIPLAYVGLTFVIAFVKTVRKFTSPKAKRRRMVNKNATLCKSLDDLFQKGRDEVKPEALKELEKQAGFGVEEILRKYIRYVLNEKPFNPDVVADLIQLRRASMLNDSQVAEVLNEISRRIVRDKGPVVMDTTGYTEKGFKRKLAVQALFGKVFYLSELPEFCSKDSSLVVKEIFGVTDRIKKSPIKITTLREILGLFFHSEDADKLRIHTNSEAGDLDSLEKMVDGPETEDSE
ncbi:uncharacterized protein G2W53_036299 [Senna tora]|uniref:Armadillo-like repeats domain-containing protein n=1 Tax=Senna tora TaxID=362788 RepID=A0A834W8L0_9FABA|nr:uncharacterized protein G2W53_036299 [Senna tora]